MLAQIRGFNAELQGKIADATAELTRKNRALEELNELLVATGRERGATLSILELDLLSGELEVRVANHAHQALASMTAGDWYDVVPLPDGRTLVTIGDVMGHGIDAAASTSRLRQLVLAMSIQDDDPASVLRRVALDARLPHADARAEGGLPPGAVGPHSGLTRCGRSPPGSSFPARALI